jgi:monoamine oxidase
MELESSTGQAITRADNPSKVALLNDMELCNMNTSSAATPRIVIVGAGLAGLTCAYRLKQAGIPATIYEATDRVGGLVGPEEGFSMMVKLLNAAGN